MEPHNGSRKVRLELERLEDRLAPSHVRLPLPPSDPPGIQVAAQANPHVGGFRELRIGSATSGAGAG
jgi:hypothetical protein